MGKREEYAERLRSVQDWEAFLKRNSGLPGPRGNLELAQAAADAGTRRQFKEWRGYNERRAPANSAGEFVAFCGVLGLGRLLAEGETSALTELRAWASDPRWRLREAVAMAMQRYGERSLDRMLKAAEDWSRGTPLEQRAAAASACEPRLIARPVHARRVLRMLDRITGSMARAEDRRSDEHRTLRQGLGYCWSVAIVALPEVGKPLLEKWAETHDRDVQWVVRENLKKARLLRMDRRWVVSLQSRVPGSPTADAARIVRKAPDAGGGGRPRTSKA
jgi:hypothetical protein